VTQLKRTTIGAGFGGEAVASRVVTWEQNQNRIFLRELDYDLVAAAESSMAQAVAAANTPTILRAINIAAMSPVSSPVIDVTSLFLSEVPEFSPRQRLGARGMDTQRSYLEKAVSFPENINVQVVQTYVAGADATARGRAGMRGSSGTVVLFHSIVRLPETPMTPRLADSRVGYFATSAYDFGRDEHKAVEREFIARHRLEKQDPDAAVSEPVEPLVYYVDPATPAKFVPWVKKGIEAWQPAFEAAGFKNAIVARDAPSEREDPDWDPEDVRYSVVRWLPSTEENAYGPSVVDPRSGEILEGDIRIYHNIQNLATMWYFTQVGPLDPRAATLPLPDDLVGRLLQFIVSHEVGHTLGLRHNNKASSLYTLDQVRDKTWVAEHSHTPTVMDYARFNYVAQPEDGIAIDDLVPKIGPYDKWAIQWGYTPISDATTADAEKTTLDGWAREQDTKPYLRFSTSSIAEDDPYPLDPGQEREAVGDADATAATALGLKNLQRVADLLVPATTRPGESYDTLREAYARLVTQWRLEMGHVANVVGGVDSRELYGSQTGPRFSTVPKARQAAAVEFLGSNAFRTPSFLLRPDLLRRIEPVGAVSRVRVAQTSLLNSLLQSSRLERLVEQSAFDPAAYTPLQFLSDLRGGIWSELRTPTAAVDIYRRNVQRAYLETIDNRLNEGAEPSAEIRAMLRGELRTLDQQIARALPLVTDAVTRRHLQDARDMVAEALDPRAMRTRAGTGAAGRGGNAFDGLAVPVGSARTLDAFDFENDPYALRGVACWLDALP
jgi:hypothetical protein